MKLRACAGAIDITPEILCELGGYEHRKGHFEGIAEKLEINGIVFCDSRQKLVLMSADLLYVTEEIKAEVWLRSGASHSVPSCNFVFGASHTHFAPAVDRAKPRLGRVHDGYVETVIDKASILLRRLLDGEGEELTLTYAEAECQNAVNRRRRGWGLVSKRWPFVSRRVEMAPCAAGVTDNVVRAIGLRDGSGELRATIWSYCCHPTASPNRMFVSADYPGLCRSALRLRFAPSGKSELPVIFFQGFSGNVRPNLANEIRNSWLQRLTAAIQRVLGAPSFKPFTVDEFDSWVRKLSTVLERTMACQSNQAEEAGRLQVESVAVPLDTVLVGGVPGAVVSFRRIDLSSSLRIVAVSAEVVAEYALALLSSAGHAMVIPVGCVEGTFGYLPTDEIVAEGGYEGGGFLKLFGYSSWVSGRVEVIARGALKQIGALD